MPTTTTHLKIAHGGGNNFQNIIINMKRYLQDYAS